MLIQQTRIAFLLVGGFADGLPDLYLRRFGNVLAQPIQRIRTLRLRRKRTEPAAEKRFVASCVKLPRRSDRVPSLLPILLILVFILASSLCFARYTLHELPHSKENCLLTRPSMAAVLLPLCRGRQVQVRTGMPSNSRCMHAGALISRDTLQTRLLCYGKIIVHVPRRKVAQMKTGIQSLVEYCDCAHTKFESKSS